MAVAAKPKSRTSFHIEKCDFNELVLNKIFYFVVFNCRNRLATVKYTSNLLLENLFSNFKLQKHQIVLVCCFR